MYTIEQLKLDLAGLLQGTNLNKIIGINDLISRAARDVQLDVDLPETKRTMPLSNAVYDQIYDYIMPDDVKGNKIINIYPVNNQSYTDDYPNETYDRDFTFARNFMVGNQFNVQNNNGIKSLRLSNYNLVPRIVVNGLDSLTANGTWAATTGFGNLEVDPVQFLSGSGALKVNATGTSGYIENNTMSPVNLSYYQDFTSFFVMIYIPNSTGMTSFNLRWGSSSANYYNQTVTTGHVGSFINGWNVIRFDWDNASFTGTPDDTAINYIRITANYTADQTGLRFDSLTNNKGRAFNIEYYSKYLFRSQSGVWQETVQNDTDLVNADTESYNLLLYKTYEYAALNIQQPVPIRNRQVNVGQTSGGTMYDNELRVFKSHYKSEALVPVYSYYRMPITGRRYTQGRIWNNG